MDEKINEKIKKTLTDQIELLSKKSADEVDSHKVHELSKAMCQVVKLLLKLEKTQLYESRLENYLKCKQSNNKKIPYSYLI